MIQNLNLALNMQNLDATLMPDKLYLIYLLHNSLTLCKILGYYWLQLDRTDNSGDRLLFSIVNSIFIMTNTLLWVSQIKCVKNLNIIFCGNNFHHTKFEVSLIPFTAV